MSKTSNSFSGLLQQFMGLQTNAMQIIGKLSECVTSNKDTVELNLKNDDGSNQIFQIPSMGYLKNRIDLLEKNIETLSGLNDSNAKIRMPDGTYKTIFTASVAKDPTPIGNLVPPTSFKTRSNWFFESFLNPLLYVNFDISSFVDQETERVRVLRLILNLDTQEKINYFNNNIKGKNDIVYETLLEELQKRNISWTVDDDIISMEPAIARFSGSFDVINVIEDEVPTTINGQTITIKNRYYRLSKINYTDNLENVTDNKILKNGDILLSGNNTKYLVESVDSDKYLVKLKRISGLEPIKIGINTLEIYSPTFAEKDINVNIGFNEYQIIFLKPIDAKFEIIATKWSPGTGFYSNELIINTPSGNIQLEDYYKQEVIDFGSSLLSLAKEKPVPSVYGELPNAPILNTNNFKVVQINKHKTNTKDLEEIKKLQAEKTSLLSELQNIDSGIEKKKLELNSTNFQSDIDRKAVQNELDNLIKNKSSKTNLYTTIVNDLVTKAKDKNPEDFKPKYRVRGFWPFPDAKKSLKTNPQEVIQFEIQYRYLRPDGGTSGVDQFNFQENGLTRRPAYSEWIPAKTDIRKKHFNETTGFFEWTIEDVEDADTPNINQLDIPIGRGEKVEIKIKSVSEAGWPMNALTSDWSEAIVIDFPSDLDVGDENSFILSKATVEESRISFQQELNSRGLDLHLVSSFTKGDKYYAHGSADIASGFFTPEGNVINLFEKIKDMQSQIDNLTSLISAAKGALSVYIIDGNNKTKISNNSKTQLFAGFYDEEIGNSGRGDIITKVYKIHLENSSASTLELISQINGLLEEFLPVSDGSSYVDYNYTQRKYDKVPLVLTGVESFNVTNTIGPKQSNFRQSAQIKGQFLYSRFKDVGLTTDFYSKNGHTHLQYYPYFSGTDVTSQGGALGGSELNIWNGNITSNTGVGGGNISEFSVHLDHPKLKNIDLQYDNANKLIFPNPKESNTSLLRMPQFTISKLTGVNKVQAQYESVTDYVSTNWPTTLPVIKDGLSSDETTWDNNYPVKFGFEENDKYLVGSRTTGAYLYIAPLNFDEIIVPGTNFLARKKIEFGTNNGISIPLIFQYRLRDYHPNTAQYPKGFAGGWNQSNVQPNQITLEKSIGIDILPSQDTLFSMDITIQCKLKKDSVV